MVNDTPESKKKLTVTVDKAITQAPSYDLFLIRGTSDYMEVQLAKKTETDTEINIAVESAFRITKDAVPHFARQFSKYLQEVVESQEAQEHSQT